MAILLHARFESAAVLRADQRLRRTRSLGDVRHVEMATVYCIVEVLTALLLYAKAVDARDGIEGEVPQLSAVGA